MRFSLFNMGLAALMLLASPALAQPALTPVNPFVFKGYYDFGYAGLTFGHLGMEVEESANQYNAACDVASAGILAVFVRHSSHTTVDAAAGTIAYESHYQTRGKKRYVQMAYKNGVLAEATLIPSDPPDKRPPVSPEMKNAALDPLSFVLAMRHQVQQALAAGQEHFSLTTFDGRRVTEANFTVIGKKVLKMDGRKYATIAVKVSRKFLAGFTQSELDDEDPNEPPLTMYWSNGERLIPLRLEVPLLVGVLYANLTRQCAPDESCLLGITE